MTQPNTPGKGGETHQTAEGKSPPLTTQQGVPANIARAAIVVVGLFFGGLGVFGAATGVGLLRRLRWARYAAIVFAACGLTMALVMVGPCVGCTSRLR